MKNTTVKLTALAATAMIALAGCGSLLEDSEPVEAPTIEEEAPAEAVDAPEVAEEEPAEDEEEAPSQEGGPGVYQADMYGGGVATVSVPGTGPEDLEQYRKDAGVDPVGYLVIEMDNTQGTDEAMVFEARVVDSEGKTYKYEEVTTSTYDWSGDNYDLMDRWLDLTEKYPYSVDPTAKATVPLVGPEVPEDIASVFVEDARAEKVGDL